ncbi:MAG: DNA methyltransferase [Promethearchaeota archaeon]
MLPSNEPNLDLNVSLISSTFNDLIKEWVSQHWWHCDISQVFLHHHFGLSLLESLQQTLRNLLQQRQPDPKIVSRVTAWIQDFYKEQYTTHQLQYSNPVKNTPKNPRIAQIDFNWRNNEVIIHHWNHYHKLWQFQFHQILVTFCLRENESIKAGKYAPKKYYIPSSTIPHLHASKSREHLIFWFDYRSLTPQEKIQFRSHPQRKIRQNFINMLPSLIQTELEEWAPIQQNIREFSRAIDSNFEIFYSRRSQFLELYPLCKHCLNNAVLNFIEQKQLQWMKSIENPTKWDNSRDKSADKATELNQVQKFEKDYQEYRLSISLFKAIITQIIDTISKLESLKILFFRKPKFFLNTNYLISIPEVISTCKLHSKSYQALLQDQETMQNFSQIKEENNKKSKEKNIEKILETNPSSTVLQIIDTKLLSPQEYRQTLPYLWDYSNRMAGFCLKSENWQALNILSCVSSQKCDVIYIDPPYNTGNQDMIYQDRFIREHWLTFLKNRLIMARELLSQKGIFFSSIDDNEFLPYSLMFQSVFPYTFDNIIWHKKTQPSYLSKELITVTEYILGGKLTANSIPLMGSLGNPKKLTELINIGNNISRRILPRQNLLIANDWDGTLDPGIYGKGKLQITLLNGPITVNNGIPSQNLHLEGRFKWKQERINAEIKKGGIIHVKSIDSLRPTIARCYDKPIIKAPTTLLSKKVNDLPTNTDANKEMKDLFGISPFDYSKPTELIKYLIRAVTFSRSSGIILDFFAGSGTTAQAVIDLNSSDGGARKFILIEQGRWFDSVLLSRLKKLMISSKWRDGHPVASTGFSGIIKYGELEQYLDVWLNIIPPPFPDLEIITGKHPEDPFHLAYGLKLRSNGWEISVRPQAILSPFGYWMYGLSDGVITVKHVDFITTVNFLLRITCPNIQRIHYKSREYILVEGVSNAKDGKILVIWQDLVKSPISLMDVSLNWEDKEWQGLIKTKFALSLTDYAQVYCNGVKIHPDAVLITKLLNQRFMSTLEVF